MGADAQSGLQNAGRVRISRLVTPAVDPLAMPRDSERGAWAPTPSRACRTLVAFGYLVWLRPQLIPWRCQGAASAAHGRGFTHSRQFAGANASARAANGCRGRSRSPTRFKFCLLLFHFPSGQALILSLTKGASPHFAERQCPSLLQSTKDRDCGPGDHSPRSLPRPQGREQQ
jgi:hypothetical protein